MTTVTIAYECDRCPFAVRGVDTDEIEEITLAHDSRCTRASYTPAPPRNEGAFTIVSPDAPDILTRLRSRIRRRAGWWGRNATTTAIGALVPVAETFPGERVDGWPEWLPRVVHELYEADDGGDDEQVSADAWFSEIARLLATPVDYTVAHNRYVSMLLNEVQTLMIDDGLARRAAELYAGGDAVDEAIQIAIFREANETVARVSDPRDATYDETLLRDAAVAQAACQPYLAWTSVWDTVFECARLAIAADAPDRAFTADARQLLIEALDGAAREELPA